jgi:glycosyltransferase involved in cell wall biosynthesis
VKQLVSDLCLIDRVSFLGFVPAGEMSTLYRNATALVYPSLFGPDNLPPLEAFASGCPVLTGQIEGAEEQLGKDSALFFDPVNPAEIAESIARIVRDEAIRARIVNNGRELAAGRTPEAYVQIALQTMDAFEHWRLNWPALPRKN